MSTEPTNTEPPEGWCVGIDPTTGTGATRITQEPCTVPVEIVIPEEPLTLPPDTTPAPPPFTIDGPATVGTPSTEPPLVIDGPATVEDVAPAVRGDSYGADTPYDTAAPLPTAPVATEAAPVATEATVTVAQPMELPQTGTEPLFAGLGLLFVAVGVALRQAARR